jgi:hypothetical protein
MFLRLILATALALSAGSGSAQADMSTKVDQLFETMAFPALLDVMRTEGIDYGMQVGEDLFPDRADADWREAVTTIYDPSKMSEVVKTAFADSLAMQNADVGEIIAFFDSEPGRTFIALEISARMALLDDAVEEASKEAAAIEAIDETERFQLVKTFVETNDLVETNVVGALNANYAFYTGLMDGGGFGDDLSQEQILSDVWSQEAEIRSSTSEWVYSFLLMAYQPASDAELEAYIAFSQSEAGEDLNNALLAAFDPMFADISRALGLASSQFMAGEEL